MKAQPTLTRCRSAVRARSDLPSFSITCGKVTTTSACFVTRSVTFALADAVVVARLERAWIAVRLARRGSSRMVLP
jgi:hypothetical protein